MTENSNSLTCVHVLRKTRELAISRRKVAENVKEMYKNENARAERAKLLYLLIKYAKFETFSLRRVE